MIGEEMKALCVALIEADTEEEVIVLLRENELWDDPALWTFYGANESNYSTIGNQQSRAEAALVEKLVNSVDARLMGECLLRGIDPEGADAPQTIREAVAEFFDTGSNLSTSGLVVEWPDSLRLEVARGITVAVTGHRPATGYPSITVADCGEGQPPSMLPETILSLHRQNKLRIPFVQGKFNQGGTGALNFCGRHRLQLVVSRRDPRLLNGSGMGEDGHWGFTVVRREQRPGTRTSVFTYLAPVRASTHPKSQAVLSFAAKDLPLFPEGREAYARPAEWGTLIKLYEYQIPRPGHILRKDGLLYRLDLLLPEIALPIRLHECRKGYKGHKGSFSTNLAGFRTRLEADKAENLEFPPSSSPIRISGEELTATIFAFKKGKAETYRKDEGVIFTINGQTHGYLTTDFFRRKKVGLSYLRDSILVVLECSQMSQAARDDLFMTSRDRIRDYEFSREIKHVLEELLHDHAGLRALKERRRREEMEAKVADDRPLEEVLRSLLRDSPSLSNLFLKGVRLTNPFKPRKVREGEGEFKGERFPKFFKFKGKETGAGLKRDCHVDMRARISFETDAENEYFSRDVDPGTFGLFHVSEGGQYTVQDYVLNLQLGIATLSVRLPNDCRAGDNLRYRTEVNDVSQLEPIRNVFELHVKEAARTAAGSKQRRSPPSKKDGDDRILPGGIALPNIIEVKEENWKRHTPPFTETTALRIINAGMDGANGDEERDGQDVYDFYVNRDNVHLNGFLKTERSVGGDESELVRAQFRYGLVLLGLALIQHDADESGGSPEGAQGGRSESEERSGARLEDRVEEFTAAAAAVLLPTIRSLGELEISDGDHSGGTAGS